MTQNQRLDYLIEHLSREYNACMPSDTADKKHFLRALMNVREPKEICEKFIKIQDEFLQCELAEKGVTDAEKLPFCEEKICLWQGDITMLKCSSIVNAANSAMLGCFVPCHKCIDNAIHTFAGVQLRLECAQIMKKQNSPEKTGKAKITKAYNLPCDYVLHTVGPIVDGNLTQRHAKLLSSCYNSCLALAEKNDIREIAFPCISTGEFRFPNEKAAQIAVDTVRKYLKNSNIERVIFNVFKDEDRKIYEQFLG